MEYDFVNHPAHYGGEHDPYEHHRVVRAWGLDYHTGIATKHICRAGKKPGSSEIQDLEKAVTYLNLKIQLLLEERASAQLQARQLEPQPEIALVPPHGMPPSINIGAGPALPWRGGFSGDDTILGGGAA